MAAWVRDSSSSRISGQLVPQENSRRRLIFGGYRPHSDGGSDPHQEGGDDPRQDVLEVEPDNGPTDGERTIFVSDDGLLDTGEYEDLSAEFRHRLGILPEEEQELSEVFKVRIGLATADRDQFDRLADEIDRAMAGKDESHRTETIQRNNMEQFRRKFFQRGSPPLQYSQEPLKRPLLPKTTDVEKRASLAIWIAINRFMDGVSQRKASNPSKGLEAPIISRVWDQLETLPVPSTMNTSVASSSSKRHSSAGLVSNNSRTKNNNSTSDRKSQPSSSSSTTSKRLSLKKLFRSQSSSAYAVTASGGSDFVRPALSRTVSEMDSASTAGDDGQPEEDNTELLTSDVVKTIPNTELDLVNFIVAHGILRKDLRDEIYCQLCCQVTKNPSPESRRRAWILHALCAGCFLPSIQMCSYYYGFLHYVLHDSSLTEKFYYAACTRRILRRTNANGTRFHPPSSIELAALKDQKAVVVEVSVADGRQLRIEADSATTSSEVCASIAAMIKIKDGFGFALFVNINGNISSMGNGLDHVLDAVTECEQLARSQGRLESTAQWKLMFRKEVFTPWYSPSNDPAGTDLIYRQIVNGVHNDEYRLHTADIITFVSRCLYVERGRQVNVDFVKSRMSEYLPKSFFTKDNNNKSRDSLAKVIMSAFEKQGFSGYAVPAKFIQQEIVASASSIWPIHFSAIFEAYRIEGPQLPHNDLIIAINSSGIFLMSTTYEVVVGFHYYDISTVTASKGSDTQKPTIQLRSTDNIEFKFLSPNAETVARIVTVFLDGLRRRSRWAVAVRAHRRKVDSMQLSMKPRDLIEILDNVTSPSSSSRSNGEQMFKGRNERTGEKGKFPSSCIYVIPTTEKPIPEFMALMAPKICQRFEDAEESDNEAAEETDEADDEDVETITEIANIEASRFRGEDLGSDSVA